MRDIQDIWFLSDSHKRDRTGNEWTGDNGDKKEPLVIIGNAPLIPTRN
jgi:hypothetical protein